MSIKSFKRHELKYIINKEQYQKIKEELEKHMVLDEYCEKDGKYTLYNIYFDTENDDVIRHSLSKPYFKEKLRIRSYNIPKSYNDLVFLELKKKIGKIVSKRRITITYQDAMDLISNGKLSIANNYLDKQISSEILDFLSRYDVKPKVYISYERVAYFDILDREFRVSFDKDILSRRNMVNLINGDFGKEVIDNDTYIMEVKCDGKIPLWLCKTLSEFKIYKASFSKYGEEFKNYLINKRLIKQIV